MADTNLSHDLKVAVTTGSIYLADLEVIDADTDWVEYFFSLENSVVIEQTIGDVTEVLVDQKTIAIASKRSAGTFTFSFDAPDVSPDVLGFAFNTSTPSYAPADKVATGISTTLKLISKMIRIDYAEGHSFLAPNCELTATLSKAADGAFAVHFEGTVLASRGAGYEPTEVIFYTSS
jgi:hypothetical protein